MDNMEANLKKVKLLKEKIEQYKEKGLDHNHLVEESENLKEQIEEDINKDIKKQSKSKNA